MRLVVPSLSRLDGSIINAKEGNYQLLYRNKPLNELLQLYMAVIFSYYYINAGRLKEDGITVSVQQMCIDLHKGHKALSMQLLDVVQRLKELKYDEYGNQCDVFQSIELYGEPLSLKVSSEYLYNVVCEIMTAEETFVVCSDIDISIIGKRCSDAVKLSAIRIMVQNRRLNIQKPLHRKISGLIELCPDMYAFCHEPFRNASSICKKKSVFLQQLREVLSDDKLIPIIGTYKRFEMTVSKDKMKIERERYNDEKTRVL